MVTPSGEGASTSDGSDGGPEDTETTMRHPSFARRSALWSASFAVFATVLIPVTAGAAAPAAANQCLVQVTGQRPSGEYVLSEPTCFATYEEVVRRATTASQVTGARTTSAASVSSVLATHYDGAGYSGASFTVSGVDCGGGYVNMNATWDNRVSSTLSSICPRIRHYTGANLTGSYQDTVPSGNLSSPVNNAVSSIQYLT